MRHLTDRNQSYLTRTFCFCATAALALGTILVAPAGAASIVVNAADNIYAAGQTSTGNYGGGNVPGFVAVSAGQTSFAVSSVTGSYTSPAFNCASTAGCITLDGGGNYSNADGVGAAPVTSSNTGNSSISGITAPGAGYLVGVFVSAGGPSGAAATALNYTTGGNASESATSYSPLLDQVFFIGDGLTGNGSGTGQTFNIPTGAADLYVGISDASFFSGSPGGYGDNLGNFTVRYSLAGGTTPTVPEPASFLFVAGGLATLGGFLRFHRKA